MQKRCEQKLLVPPLLTDNRNTVLRSWVRGIYPLTFAEILCACKAIPCHPRFSIAVVRKTREFTVPAGWVNQIYQSKFKIFQMTQPLSWVIYPMSVACSVPWELRRSPRICPLASPAHALTGHTGTDLQKTKALRYCYTDLLIVGRLQ